jgi:hypothetical protein
MRKGTLPAVLALAAAALSGCGGGDGLRVEVDESSRLETAGGAAFVDRERAITRVDADGGLRAGPVPAQLGAWDVDGGDVWVATDRGVVRHDARTLRPAGPPRNDIARATDVLAVGPVVWVRSAGVVRRVDARTGRALPERVELTGGVVDDWVADERAVYAVSSRPANLSSDHWITRIDARSGRAITRQIQPRDGVFYGKLAVGAGKVWIAQDREGYEVGERYQQRSGTLTRLDPRTLRPVGGSAPIDPSPFAIEIVGTTAWVTGLDGSLNRVDARTGRAVGRRSTFGPDGAVLEAGRGIVYAARDGKLQKLDPDTLEVRGEEDVNDQLGAMALAGGTLWMLNQPTQDPETDDEPPWTLTRTNP